MFLIEDEVEQPLNVDEPQALSQISATFEKGTLVEALNAVSAVQSEADIGWIEIVFTGEKQVIFLCKSYNLSIRYTVSTEHTGDGSVKLSGKQFSEYVRQLPEAPVSVRVDYPYRMHIKCAGSSAKIQLVQDSSYSEVFPSELGSQVVLRGDTLSRWISSFKDVILVDDSRFYANGALVWLDNTTEGPDRVHLRAIASDAVRLAQAVLKDGISAYQQDEGKAIVPRKTFEELKRQCDETPQALFKVTWSQAQLSFSAETENYLLSSKCIAGVYPSYDGAFPTTTHLQVDLDVKIFLESVKRTLIFADKTKVTRLVFEDKHLKITNLGSGPKEGEEVIKTTLEVLSPFEVLYNGHQLISILNMISGSQVSLCWESVIKPVKIMGMPHKDLDVVYLLVPNRI